MAKLIVERVTQRVIGMQALANYASEFIYTAAVFVEAGMTLEQVRKIIFPHPTVGEIIREAAWQAE